MKSVHYPNGHITIAANLFTPPDFVETKLYPAIVVVHPAGGVKEQTAGTYAEKMAALGYITIAYDAAYQGESTGMPRQHEDANIRVSDISATVDYLTTLPYVEQSRIGVLGICAGGGYATAAAIMDRRLKVVAGVSTVNLGEGFRYAWDGYSTPESQDLLGLMAQAGATRTAEVNGLETQYMPLVPESLDGVTMPDLIEAYEYYRTPRAQHPNSPSRIPFADVTRLIAFDAFSMADLFLTQPLLLVAGTQANTRWFSEELFRKAASSNKQIKFVEGASHIAMYDKYVADAVEYLVPFFGENL